MVSFKILILIDNFNILKNVPSHPYRRQMCSIPCSEGKYQQRQSVSCVHKMYSAFITYITKCYILMYLHQKKNTQWFY